MQEVLLEFHRRVAEISQYFTFLQKVDIGYVKVLQQGQIENIENLLPATLKANGILLFRAYAKDVFIATD